MTWSPCSSSPLHLLFTRVRFGQRALIDKLCGIRADHVVLYLHPDLTSTTALLSSNDLTELQGNVAMTQPT